jgi:hypothetical protein
MREAIIKVNHKGIEKRWLPLIKVLQDSGQKVYQDFPKWADTYLVLSGQFESVRKPGPKRVLVLDRDEWRPVSGNGWKNMYHDIVKHFYDEFLDVTGKTIKERCAAILGYIDAEKRKAHKS